MSVLLICRQLQATNEEGNSKWSDVVCFRTLPDRPQHPSKLQVKGRVTSNSFRCTWGEYHVIFHSWQIFTGRRYTSLVMCSGPMSVTGQGSTRTGPVWAQGNCPPLIFSLYHLLLYLLVSLTFPIFPFLTRFIYFLAFPSLPILPE